MEKATGHAYHLSERSAFYYFVGLHKKDLVSGLSNSAPVPLAFFLLTGEKSRGSGYVVLKAALCFWGVVIHGMGVNI